LIKEENKVNKINGLVLSAGLSSRMFNFKPFLPYQGVSFLLSVLMKLSGFCSEIFVVRGYRSQEIVNHVVEWSKRSYRKEWYNQFGLKEENFNDLFSKVQFVYNAKFYIGMFSSLQKGCQAMLNKNWIFYHFVDQPHLPLSFYQNLIEQISSDYDWVQPKYDQRKGHPLLFNQYVRKVILDTPGSGELRLISEKKEIRKFFWECPYHQVIENFNTKSDLKFLGDNHDYI
jgi:molybdenum cofactor cytidylyltransferase